MGSADYTTTGLHTLTVPKGVSYITIVVDGAGSGVTPGGRVTGRLHVSGGQTLKIMVGAAGVIHSGTSPGAATTGGGGAGGTGSAAAGNSGGGASWVRSTSTTGTVMVVAGGAGGTSGDGGHGGQGGGLNADPGNPGVSNLAQIGNATGGTQIQGGNGGTSALGDLYAGHDGSAGVLGNGGAGGVVAGTSTYGGGGGGGGYHPGGGGQAGKAGVTSGGGGGGGSSFVARVVGYQNLQGGGGTGDGSVSMSWQDPPPADQAPSPPTQVQIDDVDAVDEMATHATELVHISAVIDDPDPARKQLVRLVVQYSYKSDFSSGVRTRRSDLIKQGGRARIPLPGLARNTQYFVRLYTRDSKGLLSNNYTSVNFWTDRSPLAPLLTSPVDNATISQLLSVTFKWTAQDPDNPDATTATQRQFQLRWRAASTPFEAAGPWTLVAFVTNSNQYVSDPGAFAANTNYEWEVRTQDPQGGWGPWAFPQSFYVLGATIPPTLLAPIHGVAVDMTKPIVLTWKFRNPNEGARQTKADLQYRAAPGIGVDPAWTIVLGTPTTPGATQSWTLPANMFAAGVQYQWSIRTTDSITAQTSDWTDPRDFWAIRPPGEAVADVTTPDTFEVIRETLGCGTHRVFVYRRGGQVPMGEITPLTDIQWTRKRDDISECLIHTTGFGDDCGQLLASMRCWMHELVVFRDGERVWEGPITRMTYTPDNVEVEAKDVMAYVYRRIMRQGYDDSYRVVNGTILGQSSVVERAALITMNALAPDDPNVLPYLSSITYPDDAGQSRVVPDFSRTAWEEIDDLAATAGLDYTTVGRRILYWDTHRPVGRLAEMRDENFNDPPVVTEYGMQTATVFAVTNNAGVYGIADADKSAYGLIEQLASAYGETEGGDTEVLTATAKLALEQTLEAQAKRSIAHRYPTPLVVRVPDNSTLNPDSHLGINQLIPGVWIPLRARGTVRDVAQWQKLDLVTVTQDNSGEQIAVTLSPAPGGGEDPDFDGPIDDGTTA